MTREDLLLVKLMEECGEVVQACSKALRFGLEDFHPKAGNFTNRKLIVKESEDVMCTLAMLQEEGTLSLPYPLPMNYAGREKIEKYLEVSKELGRLKDD